MAPGKIALSEFAHEITTPWGLVSERDIQLKTFEEALKDRLARTPEEKAHGVKMLERYASLADEIGENTVTMMFITHIIEAVTDPDSIPHGTSEQALSFSVMMSIFINGVMIGIEMERQDEEKSE